MLKIAFYAAIFTVALWLGGAGCVVMPARYYMTTENGQVVVEPAQVLMPVPVIVAAYDYYPRPVVVREYYRYRPTVYVDRYRGSRVVMVGRHHHHRYR